MNSEVHVSTKGCVLHCCQSLSWNSKNKFSLTGLKGNVLALRLMYSSPPRGVFRSTLSISASLDPLTVVVIKSTINRGR